MHEKIWDAEKASNQFLKTFGTAAKLLASQNGLIKNCSINMCSFYIIFLIL